MEQIAGRGDRPSRVGRPAHLSRTGCVDPRSSEPASEHEVALLWALIDASTCSIPCPGFSIDGDLHVGVASCWPSNARWWASIDVRRARGRLIDHQTPALAHTSSTPPPPRHNNREEHAPLGAAAGRRPRGPLSGACIRRDVPVSLLDGLGAPDRSIESIDQFDRRDGCRHGGRERVGTVCLPLCAQLDRSIDSIDRRRILVDLEALGADVWDRNARVRKM